MILDGNHDWRCDNCDSLLNEQDGFSVIEGTWRCAECGALNDVSANNVLDFFGLLRMGIDEFTSRPLEDDDY